MLLGQSAQYLPLNEAFIRVTTASGRCVRNLGGCKRLNTNCWARSGLTIPLQITLSDIKLSAFIILVFSRQKGLTLVFRNDPLESLKVSSTFDSIPFVRDYLQKEIEGQLRVLLMEEVPAIIHRLSLRLWVPEYRVKEDEELLQSAKEPVTEEKIFDPLMTAPQDSVDQSGTVLDSTQLAALSIDSSTETQSLFSQKNLLRLGALTDSHRTLSLFTPSIRDAVFRAWAGPTERGEVPGVTTPLSAHVMPSLSRMHSYAGSTSTSYTFNDTSNAPGSRPTLSTFNSAASGLSLGSGRHAKPHAGRKRKNRVVNLRREKGNGEDTGSVSDGSTMSATASSAASDIGERPVSTEERQMDPVTPPRSPSNRVRFQSTHGNTENSNTPTRQYPSTPTQQPIAPSSKQENIDIGSIIPADPPASTKPQPRRPGPLVHQPSRHHQHLHNSHTYPREKPVSESSIFTRRTGQPSISPRPILETPTAGILEQAWMMKMAGEIARKMQDEKTSSASLWDRAAGREHDAPPPAYGI